jgi:hypothetical protein
MKKILLSLLTLSLLPFSAFSMANLARFKVKTAIFFENPTKLASALQKSYNYSAQYGFDYKKLGIVETENFVNLEKMFQVKKELDQLAQKTDNRLHISKKLFDMGQFATVAAGMQFGFKIFMGGAECNLSGGPTTIGTMLMGMGGSTIGGGAYLMRRIFTQGNLAECAKIINQARDQFTNGLL